MALAKIPSAAVDGVGAVEIQVEVDVSSGLPGFTIVGLADKAVEESRERIRSALKNTGFSFPLARITVHLAPSDYKKSGLHFDLPIALGILLADKQIKKNTDFDQTLFIGGISLDGGLQPIHGTLVLVEWAMRNSFKTVVLPAANLNEAKLIDGVEIVGADNFNQVIDWLSDKFTGVERVDELATDTDNLDMDWLQIQGQERAKRAAVVAASGGHNILLEGPPGAGKTLLARGLRALLPPLVGDELIEVVKIHSVAGALRPHQSIDSIFRPFRNPHHTASPIAIVGGGSVPRPGEISLSHRGVLFLDELPEFPRSVLEALRQPLEDGEIHVSRANQAVSFPARFQLVATMNPCPCGWLESGVKDCICSPFQINAYRKRVSGPIIDRIDLYLRVPAVKIAEMQKAPNDKRELEVLKELIKQTRSIQYGRNNNRLNHELKSGELRSKIGLTPEAEKLLRQAAEKFVITGRGYHRLLKVSRTIADLVKAELVTPSHVAEALQYRFSQN
ncbi:MAG: YifB family Mg chelatase-like AAA ATPase [Patescibacteria group bacterium]